MVGTKLHLFKVVVLDILLYGSENWVSPSYTHEAFIDKYRIVGYAYMMLTARITINPEKKGLL